MEEKFRLIPFDLSKAKTNENPNGLEVVTRDGKKARIVDTQKKGKVPLVVCVEVGDAIETVITCTTEGDYVSRYIFSDYDLRLKEPIKKRRMTRQELAWWIREHPEEHREWRWNDNTWGYAVNATYIYQDGDDAKEEVNKNIVIRRNGGEWEEPLVEY